MQLKNQETTVLYMSLYKYDQLTCEVDAITYNTQCSSVSFSDKVNSDL